MVALLFLTNQSNICIKVWPLFPAPIIPTLTLSIFGALNPKAVPFAVLGSVEATMWRGLSNDIYFQVGLLVLIGLSAKNAILIVEFALQKRKEGMNIADAAVEAAKLRLRPIIMTSLAFTIGVVPLAISQGAGAASRHSIGTGVIGGMLAATFIAIIFIPMFYYVIEKLTNSEKKQEKKEKLEQKS